MLSIIAESEEVDVSVHLIPFPVFFQTSHHCGTLQAGLLRQTKAHSKFYTKTRQGADCGSDHELFIAEFRLKMKKVGKTTR